MMEAKLTAREAAYASLMRYHTQKKYANIELDTTIRRFALEGAERALYTTLTYGVIERQITLDNTLASFCNRPFADLSDEVKTILRLGAYQMLYLDRVPDYAVVDGAVELCKKYCKKASGMVNAVLRALIRAGKKVTYPDAKKDFLAYLSVKYSCPTELCQSWINDYGAETAESILRVLSHHAYPTLRANTQKISRDELFAMLQNNNIAAEKTDSPNGIRLLQPLPMTDFAPLADGLCFVQDESSQITTRLLGVKAGDTVLDACACPGGKTFSLAMLMQNHGTLWSCDLHENKLSLITRTAETLGLSCITVKAQNATVFVDEWEEKMDAVLCDVPCSGLGVIAKKPDLRYKPFSQMERLPAVQSAILQNCARYVKQGGALVYSTCTLRKAENEDVVAAFGKANPHFRIDSMQTFFPHQTHTDGFFACRMTRI